MRFWFVWLVANLSWLHVGPYYMKIGRLNPLSGEPRGILIAKFEPSRTPGRFTPKLVIWAHKWIAPDWLQ